LRKQTLKNPAEALQDTGTGGSWPISTDRIVWAIAAWEYYLTTGDKNWLKEAYDGLKYTAEKDIHVAFDDSIGLFKGEACSMDWRTHTYPNWFSNENIGESFSSGTNALHYFNYSFLEKAGTILNQEKTTVEKWGYYKNRVKTALNTYCWNKEKGLYTAYLYPAYMQYAPSDRVDIMSNGLCALLDVASPQQADQILEHYPMYPYGGAVLYPTIPDDFAYHNKSVWAVWQTPLMFMAGKRQHMPVAEHLMKSMIRQGAMFLTHKENMTYDTGFDENTALNSDRQLWSVAGYASLVYRMLFGMEYTETGIRFHPTIPAALVNGPIALENFRYRGCMLTIRVNGTGQHVKSITVNGKPESADYQLPSNATGSYTIEIEMTDQKEQAKKWTLVNPGPGKDWSPVEPILQKNGDVLSWTVTEEQNYFIKGPGIDEKQTSPFHLSGKPAGYYSVYAVNKQGFRSDLSNPVLHTQFQQRIEAESTGTLQTNATGFSGTGYVEDLVSKPSGQVFEFDVPENGNYAITLRGSNGRGPHDVYCYIRSVELDGKDIGTFILESSGNWNQWTYSNQLRIPNLSKGKHRIQIVFNPEKKGYDNNMSYAKGNGYRNDAYLDCLEVFRY
ncbi:MAG: carbohydrate-binding protein, partial [Chitinophagaceae bacterium]